MLAYAAARCGRGMKTLYVLRHGQAAPEAEAESDHARELTPRGEVEARRTAQYLSKRPSLPSLVLASSAARARQTAQLCRAVLPGVELVVLDELYLAEPSSYLAELGETADEHVAVLVVGHNPGLEALIYVLSERSEHLATASLVEVELAIAAWGELSRHGKHGARIVDIFRP
jgi:phosphohistidine phosphatase